MNDLIGVISLILFCEGIVGLFMIDVSLFPSLHSGCFGLKSLGRIPRMVWFWLVFGHCCLLRIWTNKAFADLKRNCPICLVATTIRFKYFPTNVHCDDNEKDVHQNLTFPYRWIRFWNDRIDHENRNEYGEATTNESSICKQKDEIDGQEKQQNSVRQSILWRWTHRNTSFAVFLFPKGTLLGLFSKWRWGVKFLQGWTSMNTTYTFFGYR